MRYVLLLLLLLPPFARAESVRVPGPEGIMLNAQLFPAQGKARAPAIVGLHGCGGPSPAHDEAWAKLLAANGDTVLLPDSFGSRGLGAQCSARSRPVTAAGVRRRDAVAALQWLAARPGTPPGGIVLMGWADGGSTVLATGRAAPDLPAGLLRGMVAFYPGCRMPLETKGWAPAAPLLILTGEADEAQSTPCHALAQRWPGKVTLASYHGGFHDFDAPGPFARPRRGLAIPAGGMAHAGNDTAAREDAIRRVGAFIAALP